MKPRIALTLILMLIVCGNLMAQDRGPVDQGSVIIGGSAAFTSSKYEDASSRITYVRFSPSLLYFVANSIAIGATASIESTSAGNQDYSEFSIGPKFAYFAKTKSESLFPFLGGSFTFTGGEDYSSTLIHVGGGLNTFLVSHVAVTGEMFFESQHIDPDNEWYDSYSISTFGVLFGLSVFIY